MPATLAKLVATANHPAPREIPLPGFPVRLGRRVGNDVCLDDRWVSRDHCEITRQDDVLTVRDLGSKHGTFVNGHAVAVAQLNPGDELRVGLTGFVVHYEGSAAGIELAHHAAV